MKKLKSLSIFFPFFNDERTVDHAISSAYHYGKKITSDLEVIAIHGGASIDKTYEKLVEQKKKHPKLIIIDKRKNKEGYAVIKYGFETATRDWIFYTGGDMQYYLSDLTKLVDRQRKSDSDLINGYRLIRADNKSRVFFGNFYKFLSKNIFNLPISDLTCDFRLIRSSLIKKISLISTDSSILLEFIKKLEKKGARFTQVLVRHRPRIYGNSTFNIPSLLKERVFGDLKVWIRLTRFGKIFVPVLRWFVPTQSGSKQS